MKPKPIALCAGYYSRCQPIPQCADCLRHLLPIPARGEWIAPPEFDQHCPERIAPEKEAP